jgi:hypothetical protein
METLLIDEQFVSQFKYWRAGRVHRGMRFRNDLFEYTSQFQQDQRHQAFELAWELAQAGRDIVVTASATRYIVWVNLREPNSSMLVGRGNSPHIEPFDRKMMQASRQLETALSA